MAVSEAQRKASDKYIAAHMATIGCKLKKEQAAAFKEYCKEKGTTPNAVLVGFVLDCIKDRTPASDVE
jgi:hypothetical protein